MEIKPDWKHLRTLALKLTGTSDIITSDLTPSQAAQVNCKASLFKKLEPLDRKSANNRKNAAIQNFLDCNAKCRRYVVPDGTAYVDDILNEARDIIYHDLMRWDGPVISLNDALERGYPGPGASFRSDAKSNYQKMFDSTLSYTRDGLYKHYVHNISPSHYMAEIRRNVLHGSERTQGGKLSTVVKNDTIDRTILTVPSLDMYYQLGVKGILDDVLAKNYGIIISKQQSVNRYLARIGSANGEYATIDMTSASDLISRTYVAWHLPKAVFQVLDSLRVKKYTLDGKDWSQLHIFSTMGNGFTFPLMTLIFASIVKATYALKGIPLKDLYGRPRFAVYGDDIIVDTRVYHTVVAALQRMGGEVNLSKSYSTGSFRESCGGDYFKGHSIRGVYLRKLSHEAHVYSFFNRLSRWVVRHGISDVHTLNYIRDLIPVARRFEVPFDESDDAGFKTPRAYLTNPRPTKFGCLKYKALRPLKAVSQVDVRRNPEGAFNAALIGYISPDARSEERDDGSAGCLETLRSTGPSEYQVVKYLTPSWDWLPHAGLNIRGFVLLHRNMQLYTTGLHLVF